MNSLDAGTSCARFPANPGCPGCVSAEPYLPLEGNQYNPFETSTRENVYTKFLAPPVASLPVFRPILQLEYALRLVIALAHPFAAPLLFTNA